MGVPSPKVALCHFVPLSLWRFVALAHYRAFGQLTSRSWKNTVSVPVNVLATRLMTHAT